MEVWRIDEYHQEGTAPNRRYFIYKDPWALPSKYNFLNNLGASVGFFNTKFSQPTAEIHADAQDASGSLDYTSHADLLTDYNADPSGFASGALKKFTYESAVLYPTARPHEISDRRARAHHDL